MKYLQLIIFLIISSETINAQAPSWSWEKKIGGTSNDGAKQIAIDNSGNLYITGAFDDTVDFDPGVGVYNLTAVLQGDFYVAKYDASGNFIWAKSIGGVGQDFSTYIVIDPSTGNLFIAGFFQATVDFDPGPGVFNITTNSFAYPDMFVCSLDSAGIFRWAKGIGGAGSDYASGISFSTLDNSVYITGAFSLTVDFDPGPGGYYLTTWGIDDVFVLKLTATGDFIWARQMGGSQQDAATAIVLDSSGNVYTTGWFGQIADFDPGQNDFYLIGAAGLDAFISKLDSAGNFVWAKSIGYLDAVLGYYITLSPASDIYVTGVFSSSADFDPDSGVATLTAVGGYDVFMLKLNSQGNYCWAKSFGSGGDDYGLCIVVDGDNRNLFLTGYFRGIADFDPGASTNIHSSAGGTDIFLLRLDSSGNFSWVKTTGSSNDDLGNCVILNSSGDLYVSGQFKSPTILFDSTTMVNSGINTNDGFFAKIDKNVIAAIPSEDNYYGFTLSPNPAKDYLYLKFPSEFSDRSEIKIFDILGKYVLATEMERRTEYLKLDISALIPGLYFIQVNSTGFTSMSKFIKN